MICLKDPSAYLDYGVDWSDWLAQYNDTLAESTWSAPEALTLDNDIHTDTATLVWVSGGVVGERYRLTNRITTTAGRVEERSIEIVMVDR